MNKAEDNLNNVKKLGDDHEDEKDSFGTSSERNEKVKEKIKNAMKEANKAIEKSRLSLSVC